MITYIAFTILLGWLAGMVVNYLADVLPLRRRLVKPFCQQCDAVQAWLNYFFWPRQCPVCNYRRHWRVWVVEVIFIAASILMYIHPPYRLGYGLGMLVLVYLGVVVVIDMEYRLIMHPVSIFGAVLGLVVGVLRVGWERALIGGAVGFGIMWLVYMLGVLILKLVSRMRNQPINDVALGFGDVNLSGVLGLMIGWPLVLLGLVTAILIGGAVSLVFIVFKLLTHRYEAFLALPYGPFLVTGAIPIIYFRDYILRIMGE